MNEKTLTRIYMYKVFVIEKTGIRTCLFETRKYAEIFAETMTAKGFDVVINVWSWLTYVEE